MQNMRCSPPPIMQRHELQGPLAEPVESVEAGRGPAADHGVGSGVEQAGLQAPAIRELHPWEVQRLPTARDDLSGRDAPRQRACGEAAVARLLPAEHLVLPNGEPGKSPIDVSHAPIMTTPCDRVSRSAGSALAIAAFVMTKPRALDVVGAGECADRARSVSSVAARALLVAHLGRSRRSTGRTRRRAVPGEVGSESRINPETRQHHSWQQRRPTGAGDDARRGQRKPARRCRGRGVYLQMPKFRHDESGAAAGDRSQERVDELDEDVVEVPSATRRREHVLVGTRGPSSRVQRPS